MGEKIKKRNRRKALFGPSCTFHPIISVSAHIESYLQLPGTDGVFSCILCMKSPISVKLIIIIT